jgi:hypothetical protein
VRGIHTCYALAFAAIPEGAAESDVECSEFPSSWWVRDCGWAEGGAEGALLCLYLVRNGRAEIIPGLEVKAVSACSGRRRKLAEVKDV